MFGAITNAISSVGKALSPVKEYITGGLNLLGGIQQNQSAWDIAQAAQAASAEQASRQMDFQREMRATQYQTVVEDLKKAGLNPMLAYTQGGAGTPAGASGSAYTAPVRNVLGEAASAFMAAQQNDADVAMKNAAATNTSAQTIKVEADTIKTAVDIQKTLEDTKVSQQQYVNMQKMLDKLTQEIVNLKESAALTSAQAKNVKENIAPSTDPYWYRDLKKNFPTPTNLENLIKQQYLKYKGAKK